ncbi:hypothetical protein J5491_02845 [Candidatus Saccharibacteria bacterium]|nr:hypothetical protein [Candidatus Saccharibacteria bacterium]
MAEGLFVILVKNGVKKTLGCGKLCYFCGKKLDIPIMLMYYENVKGYTFNNNKN